MEKNEQNKEKSIGKPAKILERRKAIFFDKEELVALQKLQKAPSRIVAKPDQQSFHAIASNASQKTKDKAQVLEIPRKTCTRKKIYSDRYWTNE